MMWIDNQSRIFSAHHDIRQAFPRESLPAVITDEALAALGVYPVTISARPEYDAVSQYCVSTAPVIVDGMWVQGWDVIDKDPAEVAASQQAAATAYRNEIRDAIQAMLDAECKPRDYDNMNNATGWAPFYPKAMALALWGKSCWDKSTTIEEDVLAGTRPVPTVAEVIAEMPTFEG